MMGIKCFKVVSKEALRRFYRLRFQVYCKEWGYMHENNYPEGSESDDYDDYSVHFCAQDAQENMIAGVRLILPECGKFPIEQATPDVDLDRLGIKREECAEISRLVFTKRRPQPGVPSSSQTNPLLVDLCRQMYKECGTRGIKHCLAMMTSSLHLLLKFHGFPFERIGNEFEYFGRVFPYKITFEAVSRLGILDPGTQTAKQSLQGSLARG